VTRRRLSHEQFMTRLAGPRPVAPAIAPAPRPPTSTPFARKCLGLVVPVEERLFVAVYPTGIVYCDRASERDGDYQRIAFLSYSSLVLEWDPHATREPVEALRAAIEADAARMQARRGERFKVSTAGQYIVLGESQAVRS
jgi:hypothetical protein